MATECACTMMRRPGKWHSRFALLLLLSVLQSAAAARAKSMSSLGASFKHLYSRQSIRRPCLHLHMLACVDLSAHAVSYPGRAGLLPRSVVKLTSVLLDCRRWIGRRCCSCAALLRVALRLTSTMAWTTHLIRSSMML